MKSRKFDLSDVLSITTGALVSTRHIEGVYDIIGYVTGDSGVTTVGLVMLLGPVKEAILEQHPGLAEVTFPHELVDDEMTTEDRVAVITEWLRHRRMQWGDTLDIAPMGEPVVVSIEDQIGYIHNANPGAKVIVAEEVVSDLVTRFVDGTTTQWSAEELPQNIDARTFAQGFAASNGKSATVTCDVCGQKWESVAIQIAALHFGKHVCRKEKNEHC